LVRKGLFGQEDLLREIPQAFSVQSQDFGFQRPEISGKKWMG
jgi:hypothetical protein